MHPGFPAVLAPCRPLRNSHIPVLEHARFPLQVAPLLGASQGTPFSFDPASCLVLEASFRFEVLGQIESGALAAEQAPLYGLAVIT